MEIIDHPLFGKSIVATRAYAAGELFLRETPLIVCKDTNDPSNGFAKQLSAIKDAYLNATPQVQEKIMAMMWYDIGGDCTSETSLPI